ncbi:hypothetical protein MTP99_009901 [Tenebrio molitor]|nr:hypothetical protein MTP99_009901 [Tenebrio molitor]
MLVTRSSEDWSLKICVKMNFPASAASRDQSLLTMSNPLYSISCFNSPLLLLVSVTAAYFFFLSSNKYLKTPSMSSSTWR